MLRKMFRLIYVIIISFVLSSCLCTMSGDESKPFEMFVGPSSTHKMQLTHDDVFGLAISLVVVRPINNMKIKIELPKEVSVKSCFVETLSDVKEGYRQGQKLELNGQNIYQLELGSLSPDRASYWWEELTWDRPTKGKRLDCQLTSITSGSEWSSPVKASLEFDYVKAKNEAGVIGNVESGHYVSEFSGASGKWLSQHTSP